MSELAPKTPHGRAALAALVADPRSSLAAFDYDGTLAPIVGDPATASALPGIVAALADLTGVVGQVAIITGRPAATAVSLAGLTDAEGLERLVVLGQYGLERWESSSGELTTVAPDPGLDVVRREVSGVLRSAGVHDAVVEDKGLAVAVHVRRSAAPAASYAKIEAPLVELADRTGLVAERGRLVVELRPRGMDKGKALLALAEEVGAGPLMFTGDDLGDLAAFDAVDTWRARGGAGLLVCSGSAEVAELAARADLVVDGPPGVLDMIRTMVALLNH